MLSVVSWDGGLDGTGTDWHEPVNWVGDELPGAADDVVVDAGYPDIVASGDVTIKSVTSDSPIEISGGSFSVAEPSTLSDLVVSNGTLTGDGVVTVTDTLSWSGGTMSGTGKTVLASGANGAISGTSANKIVGRTLENAGTIDYTGTRLYFGAQADEAGIIDNLASGQFNVTGEGDFDYSYIGAHAFNNAGTFTKSGEDTTTCFSGVAFNNPGTTAVQSGTLQLVNGGTADGSFNVNSGAMLDFAGGTYHFEDGWSLTGVGDTRLSAATLDIAAEGSVDVFVQIGGVLTGDGVVTVTDTLSWSGGTMSGTGKTVLASGANGAISGTSANKIVGRRLENAGTIDYTGTRLHFGAQADEAGIIDNLASGQFNVTGEGDFDYSYIGAHAFNNAGTFAKSGEDTTTRFSGVAFNNPGTTAVQSGTLQLVNGGTADGSFNVNSGAMIDFAGGTYHFEDGWSLAGVGDTRLSAATLDIAAEGSVDVFVQIGGVLTGDGVVTVTDTLSWSGGTMSGTGKTVLASGANGAISGTSANKIVGRTLENAGTIDYTGTRLHFGAQADEAGIIDNLASGQFNVTGEGDFDYSYIGAHAFNNAGTFAKSGEDTTTRFSGVAFNNPGTTAVQSGTLQLVNGGTADGSFNVNSGAMIDFAGGTYGLDATSSIVSAGTVRFSGGTTTVDGNYNVTDHNEIAGGIVTFNTDFSVPTLTQIGGVLTGDGVVTVTDTLSWSGGTMSGTGKTVLASGANGAISGTSANKIVGRRLENAGTIDYTGTRLHFGAQADEAGIIDNLASGQFNVTGEGDFDYSYIGAHAFNNAGTFAKSGEDTTTCFSGVAFNSTGSLQVQLGTLDLAGSIVLDGNTYFATQPGSSVLLDGDLVGDTLNADLFAPEGTTRLDGTSNSVSPTLLEVMGRDLGADAAGFVDNFAYGRLVVDSYNYIQLIDNADNAPGEGDEALYANELAVVSESTLDLNGHHVYVRAAQLDGTILGGSVHLLPDGGPMPRNTVVPGNIEQSGETDELDVFRSGRTRRDHLRRHR